MPMNFPGGLSPAGASLGLGSVPGLGDALAGQTADQTEELRKKKMLEAQQRAFLGTGGSAASASLFGNVGGPLRRNTLMVLTGNSTVDPLIQSAESIRQGVVNGASVTQAQANTATVTYYKSVLSAKLASGLDIGNEIGALKSLATTV